VWIVVCRLLLCVFAVNCVCIVYRVFYRIPWVEAPPHFATCNYYYSKVKRAFFYPDNDTVETIELHSTALFAWPAIARYPCTLPILTMSFSYPESTK
jgi:hypothetical protein